jgi:hypothetical protein
MYGFGKELTKENIYDKISSYDIFKYYCEPFEKVNKNFFSELRSSDKNTLSCCIAQKNGDLLYSDFGSREHYDAIRYIQAKYSLNYFEALNKINIDFNLKLGIIIPHKKIYSSKKSPLITNKKFVDRGFSILKKKSRPFTKDDLDYWNSFYWTEWMLNEAKTESISHYWINDSYWKVKSNELAFSYEYYWHNDRKQRKLYFPLRQNYKWFSNVDNTIVQLVDVMPKTGDILFITSSKKDAGIFWRLQLDNYFPDLIIHGVAPNNEGSFVPEEWFNKMKLRWKRIILWYNNDWNKLDNTGIINSKRYSEKYGIEWYVNPDNEPKDPSDFCKKYDLKEFKQLIMNKL